jgi:flagellar motor switch/type III secretory pathway protein FliN
MNSFESQFDIQIAVGTALGTFTTSIYDITAWQEGDRITIPIPSEQVENKSQTVVLKVDERPVAEATVTIAEGRYLLRITKNLTAHSA